MTQERGTLALEAYLGTGERYLERVAFHRAQEAFVELLAQLPHHLRAPRVRYGKQ